MLRQVFRVPSNREGEDPYIVTSFNAGERMVCTCKGFSYRRRCSHCDRLRGVVALPTDNQVVIEEIVSRVIYPSAHAQHQ